MKAELKGLHSPDVDDLENWVPRSPESFQFLLQLLVGPEGERGEESFDLLVSTPDRLILELHLEKVVAGTHRIFMLRYDYHTLKELVTSLVEACSGETWDEVAQCVSRIGQWEFANYPAD